MDEMETADAALEALKRRASNPKAALEESGAIESSVAAIIAPSAVNELLKRPSSPPPRSSGVSSKSRLDILPVDVVQPVEKRLATHSPFTGRIRFFLKRKKETYPSDGGMLRGAGRLLRGVTAGAVHGVGHGRLGEDRDEGAGAADEADGGKFRRPDRRWHA
eukprot:1185790-Prorocentrum_minimum.AAC.11